MQHNSAELKKADLLFYSDDPETLDRIAKELKESLELSDWSQIVKEKPKGLDRLPDMTYLKGPSPCTDCPRWGFCMGLEMACVTFFVYINEEEPPLIDTLKKNGLSHKWQDHLNARKPSLEWYDMCFPEYDDDPKPFVIRKDRGAAVKELEIERQNAILRGEEVETKEESLRNLGLI